jgi:hypothetical protein
MLTSSLYDSTHTILATRTRRVLMHQPSDGLSTLEQYALWILCTYPFSEASDFFRSRLYCSA